MSDTLDYGLLDRSGAAAMIFFPRRDDSPAPPGAVDHAIDVAPGVRLGARLYTASREAPTVLYFHGNGEVVSDHDGIAPFYAAIGLNLFVVDLRGYGRSSGSPSFGALIGDAGSVVRHFHETLDALGYDGTRVVMGRSLGTQPALEVASNHAERFRGLIIESGAGNLRRLAGFLGLNSESGPGAALVQGHEAKVRSVTMPALLIHGELDELIPLEHAADTYSMLGSAQKELVVIEGAGHNDLLWLGREEYFGAIARFVDGLRR